MLATCGVGIHSHVYDQWVNPTIYVGTSWPLLRAGSVYSCDVMWARQCLEERDSW